MSVFQSKVTAVKSGRSFSGPHGELYPYNITFEDGTYGMYLSQSADQNKFVIGQPAWYSKESKVNKNGENYFKIRPAQAPDNAQEPQAYPGGGGQHNKPQPKQKDDVQRIITRQSSLNRAVELTVAGLIQKKDIMQFADYFTEWCLGRVGVIEIADDFFESEAFKMEMDKRTSAEDDGLPPPF